jgi:hypothetical protein
MLQLEYMLMGAQAAGLITNIYGMSEANKMNKLGTQLDQQALGLQMEQERLASTEQALANTENLRSILSTQRALMASRNQMPGVGSAGASEQKAIRNYNADESARNLNMVFRQAHLTGQSRLLDIKRFGAKAERGAALAAGSFNNISFNTLLGKYANQTQKKPKLNDAGGTGSINGG